MVQDFVHPRYSTTSPVRGCPLGRPFVQFENEGVPYLETCHASLLGPLSPIPLATSKEGLSQALLRDPERMHLPNTWYMVHVETFSNSWYRWFAIWSNCVLCCWGSRGGGKNGENRGPGGKREECRGYWVKCCYPTF